MNYQVTDFGYSTKNIPLASKSKYLQTLIDRTQSLKHRMRWKAFFFLQDHDTTSNAKETYSFKSKRPPPHVRALDEFEDNMLNMIQRVEFKTNSTTANNLQAKLDKDVQEIRQDKKIYVKADKTTNHYKVELQDYLNLLQKNVTKAYKKSNKNNPDLITSADKKIAQDLILDDRNWSFREQRRIHNIEGSQTWFRKQPNMQTHKSYKIRVRHYQQAHFRQHKQRDD